MTDYSIAVDIRHYGFTDEELDFIINHDIKYRTGNTDDENGMMVICRELECFYMSKWTTKSFQRFTGAMEGELGYPISKRIDNLWNTW